MIYLKCLRNTNADGKLILRLAGGEKEKKRERERKRKRQRKRKRERERELDLLELVFDNES